MSPTFMVDGEKMSKSKGNFYTLRDLTRKAAIEPRALRLLLMADALPNAVELHVRRALSKSTGEIQRLDDFMARLDRETPQRPGRDEAFDARRSRSMPSTISRSSLADDLERQRCLRRRSSVSFKEGQRRDGSR